MVHFIELKRFGGATKGSLFSPLLDTKTQCHILVFKWNL
jgi:hypothetical protein